MFISSTCLFKFHFEPKLTSSHIDLRCNCPTMSSRFDAFKRRLKSRASRQNPNPGGAQSIQQLGSIPPRRTPSDVSHPSLSNHPPLQSNASVLPTCTARASASSNNRSQFSASQDLWEEALQKVSAEHRAAIQHELSSYFSSPQQPLSDMIDHLHSLTEQKRAECEKRGWKFEYNGQQVILRDVAEKVIVWLNKFKEVGDVAFNFDPVHLALPWAGVRFLLQVCHGSPAKP